MDSNDDIGIRIQRIDAGLTDLQHRQLVAAFREDVRAMRLRRERRKTVKAILLWLAIVAGLGALALAQLF